MEFSCRLEGEEFIREFLSNLNTNRFAFLSFDKRRHVLHVDMLSLQKKINGPTDIRRKQDMKRFLASTESEMDNSRIDSE